MSWGHLSSCGEGILSSSGVVVPLTLLLEDPLVMQNRAPLELRRILSVPLELDPVKIHWVTRGSIRVSTGDLVFLYSCGGASSRAAWGSSLLVAISTLAPVELCCAVVRG